MRLLICLAALSVAAPAFAAESLVAEPHPGGDPWKPVADQKIGAGSIRLFIPPDHPAKKENDLLAVQSVPGGQGKTPTEALKAFWQGTGSFCQNMRINPSKENAESGYDEAYIQVYCGRRRGWSGGVHIFAKAIRGDEAMYIVWREVPWPASDTGGIQSFSADQMTEMVAHMKADGEANEYLVKTVHLCGDKAKDARCAAPTPAPPPGGGR